MVNWIMNVAATKSQCSCSCCGCCCHAMRAIKEFNVPGMIAPPHFLPRLDPAKCVYCGRCAAACPMAAIVVDAQGEDLAAPPGALHRLRTVRGGLRAEAGDRHGARARLQVALQELVCPAQPVRPADAEDLLEGVARSGDRRRGAIIPAQSGRINAGPREVHLARDRPGRTTPFRPRGGAPAARGGLRGLLGRRLRPRRTSASPAQGLRRGHRRPPGANPRTLRPEEDAGHRAPPSA